MSSSTRPCVTLADHKVVVKRWHERAARPARYKGSALSARDEQTDQSDSHWPTGRRDNNANTGDQESFADDASVIVDGQDDDDDTDGPHDPGPLRTVGQIKHAYRTRARRDEAESERKAVQLQLERRKRQPIVSHSPLNRESVGVKPTPSIVPSSSPSSPQGECELKEAADTQGGQADTQKEHTGAELLTLNSQALVSSAEYHANVLRTLRKELSVGRDVRVSVRCLDVAALQDVKLAVQLLCTESLLFCVCDQNVIPLVDPERGEVILDMLARRSESRRV